MDGMRLSGKCPEARYCPFPKVSAECPEGVRAKRGKCPERVRNVSARQSSGAGRTHPFYKGVLSDPVAPPSSRVPDTRPRPVSACLARPSKSCDCDACVSFDAALRAHTDAIGRGHGDSTRAALRTAACAVDTAHGLAKAPA